MFKTENCYLDKDVLSMVIIAKQKKENDFIEKVTKLYMKFCDKKKEYGKVFQQLVSLEIKEDKFVPVKLLKPLCSYKKGKETRQFQQNKINWSNNTFLLNPVRIWI